MGKEVWLPVVGFEGLYEVSNCGRVRRTGGNYLSGNLNSYGYRVVKLTKGGKSKDLKVHRLVAGAFIPNDYGKSSVNHIDGNKDNNRVENLEWVTKGENNRHARDVLHVDYSSKPVWQLSLDGTPLALYANSAIASEITGVNAMMIGACCKGTARTAGDYLWQYDTGSTFKSDARDVNIQQLSNQVQQLQEKIEQLKGQQL